MGTKAKELIKLAKDFAKEKGFELSKTEKKLLTSVAEGENADYSSSNFVRWASILYFLSVLKNY